MILTVSYPALPPTSNRIYFKGTQLTAAARQYAEDFSHYVTQHYLHQTMKANPEGIFAVHLRFYFNSLQNESWQNPNFKPSKRAKSRYKRIDLDNRIKLLTDCVRDMLDIDDSRVFAGSQEKHEDPGNERVEITIQEVDPSLFGIEEPAWRKEKM